MEASLDERTAYLNELKNKSNADAEDKNAVVIKMLQDLTVLGYFTSEIGATQQLRYYEVPGKYDPCIEYKPGEKAYAI
jgi:hypothetical protein